MRFATLKREVLSIHNNGMFLLHLVYVINYIFFSRFSLTRLGIDLNGSREKNGIKKRALNKKIRLLSFSK